MKMSFLTARRRLYSLEKKEEKSGFNLGSLLMSLSAAATVCWRFSQAAHKLPLCTVQFDLIINNFICFFALALHFFHAHCRRNGHFSSSLFFSTLLVHASLRNGSLRTRQKMRRSHCMK